MLTIAMTTGQQEHPRDLPEMPFGGEAISRRQRISQRDTAINSN
jgi:hypothetical protein